MEALKDQGFQLQQCQEKCKNLEEMCGHYKTLWDKLTDQNNKLEQTLKEKATAYEQLRQQCEDKARQNLELDKQLDTFQVSNRNLRHGIEQLEQSLKQTKLDHLAEQKQLALREESLKRELSEVRSKLEDATHEIDTLRLEKLTGSKVTQRIEQLESELERVNKSHKEEIESLQKQLQGQLDSLTLAHKEEMENSEIILKAKELRIFQLEEQKSAHESKLQKTEQKMAEMSELMQRMQLDNHTLTQAIGQHQEEIDALENALVNAEEEIKDLQSQLQQYSHNTREKIFFVDDECCLVRNIF
ncbi:GTPase [Reticulomyxa filosa]|uniref:GTPase n=1 Tax=Reticulomyxa filosa TaxID=46433 RepID=X6MQS6_RETFI|nr:GTPase [Reticulomyxa filosa]|eukprot:ETO15797.1 GTPase [Reticulomyxa filosa]